METAMLKLQTVSEKSMVVMNGKLYEAGDALVFLNTLMHENKFGEISLAMDKASISAAQHEEALKNIVAV